MEGQFITNKELILSDIINSILPKCDNAYFLVGYFYFSGFAELCDKLKDVNLKVLVGNIKFKIVCLCFNAHLFRRRYI